MCLICDRINMIKRGENPYFVYETKTGYVVIGDHQHFKGYTLFLCKEHKTDMDELDKDVRSDFLTDMAQVAGAVKTAFRAEKINCELLGNGDAHLHWHIFPRRDGDLGNYGISGKGPVWWYPPEKMYDDNNRPDERTLKEMKCLLYTRLKEREI